MLPPQNNTERLLVHLRSLSSSDPQSLLTAYTQALAHLRDDPCSLEIFADYVRIACAFGEVDEVGHIYNLMKVKLRAYRSYWLGYLRFEVLRRGKSYDSVFSKIMDYLRVKVFSCKDVLVEGLLADKEAIREECLASVCKDGDAGICGGGANMHSGTNVGAAEGDSGDRLAEIHQHAADSRTGVDTGGSSNVRRHGVESSDKLVEDKNTKVDLRDNRAASLDNNDVTFITKRLKDLSNLSNVDCTVGINASGQPCEQMLVDGRPIVEDEMDERLGIGNGRGNETVRDAEDDLDSYAGGGADKENENNSSMHNDKFSNNPHHDHTGKNFGVHSVQSAGSGPFYRDEFRSSPHKDRLKASNASCGKREVFELTLPMDDGKISAMGKHSLNGGRVPNSGNSSFRGTSNKSHPLSEERNNIECEILENTQTFNRNLSTVAFKNREAIKISRIGRGGYSAVYKILIENEVYALKQIQLEDKDSMKISMDEINMLKKLNNEEYIIKLVDYDVTKDRVDILLEYGEIDLERVINSNILNMLYIKYIWHSILNILLFIHQHRIIHRDIKPANFVLVRGKIKLIDFGISRSMRGDTTSVLNVEKAGTLNYISPEQCAGGRVSRASDVWSAGCILYYMVYKRHIHPTKDVMGILRSMSEERPVEYGPADAMAVESIKQCLRYDPKARAKVSELLGHRFLK